MLIKKITLKPETTNAEYTQLCNKYDKKGMLRACGNPDNKWLILSFDDELDFLAWMAANNIITNAERSFACGSYGDKIY